MTHSAPMENEKLNVGRPSMRKKFMYCGTSMGGHVRPDVGSDIRSNVGSDIDGVTRVHLNRSLGLSSDWLSGRVGESHRPHGTQLAKNE